MCASFTNISKLIKTTQKRSSGLKMPKRTKTRIEKDPKKRKTASEETSLESVHITSKQNRPSQESAKPWSSNEMLELLKQIEENIPKDDTLSYSSRLEKFNWENIQVENYSALECQETWNSLYKQVRKFRYLQELVNDMKEVVTTRKPTDKHPAKPKQPLNSYMLFVEEHREKVMHKNPMSHPNEISKLLGQMYRSLPLERREKYEQEAKTTRQEYLLKLQKFYDEYPDMIPKSKKKGQKKVSSTHEGAPEKPKTPFELFVNEEAQKEDASSSRFVVMQKCREQWNEFTDKEKYFWIKWAEQLYGKYLDDLREYMKTHHDYKPEKTKTVLTKKEQQIRDRCSGKPDKPPHGAYQLFSKMILESEEVRRINTKDVLNYISEKWRACSDEEKNEYKLRMEQMWEDHHKKLEDYLLTLPPEDRDQVREEESRKKKKVPETRKESVPKVAKLDSPSVGKPETPPATVQKYFLKVYTGEGDPNHVWENMTEQERKVFKVELDLKKREYIAAYEKYLKSLSREELQQLGASLTSQGDSSESELESSEEEEEDEDTEEEEDDNN